MSSRKRLLLIGGGVVVAVATWSSAWWPPRTVVPTAHRARRAAPTPLRPRPTARARDAGDKRRNRHNGEPDRQSPAPAPEAPRTKASGVVNADTDAKYGQSPSSGTCAHWSERFINNSTAKVVQITFAPGQRLVLAGQQGRSRLQGLPGQGPRPRSAQRRHRAEHAEAIQFMALHGHCAPERNRRPAHRCTERASVEVGKRRDGHARLPVVPAVPGQRGVAPNTSLLRRNFMNARTWMNAFHGT